MASNLPRFQGASSLVDTNGNPSLAFHMWWDKVASSLEASLTDLTDQQASLFEALSTMSDIPDAHITADYTGLVDPNQLPYYIQADRLTGSTDNSNDATWDFTTDNDGITATIDSTGLLTITDIVATTVVTITSTYRSVVKTKIFTVYFDVATAPVTTTSTGTSGTSTSTSTFISFNTTTESPVTNTLTVTVGSGGNITLSAPLKVSTDAVSPTGSYRVYGIWQRLVAGVWTDLGVEKLSGTTCSVGQKFISTGIGYAVKEGSLSVSVYISGLTPATTESFRFEARNNTGTRTMYVKGTASVVST